MGLAFLLKDGESKTVSAAGALTGGIARGKTAGQGTGDTDRDRC